MAIQYLSSIDLNQNEALHLTVENQGSDTLAGTGVDGQIYFNTTSDKLKVWFNSQWNNVGGFDGSGAAGAVTIWNDADTLGYDANFVWDSVNGRLGINTSPSYSLDVNGELNVSNDAYFGADIFGMEVIGNTFGPTEYISFTGNQLKFGAGGSDKVIFNSTGSVAFTSYGSGTVTGTAAYALSVDSSGNIIESTYGNQTITLSGEVTGSGTTSITTTVADNVLDVANFNATAIVTEAEGIENNDNDTTLPTSAAVKAYADSLIVGGLIYQGGYNATANPPSTGVKKGWTYTVTTAGSGTGGYWSTPLEVGDVIIAEIDTPTTEADWTTVQNNIDLASLTQVGIGNVNAGTGISVSYTSGTATVTNTDTNSANTATGTITAGNTSGSVSHSFGINTIVQTIDSSGNTVYCDIARTSTSVTASIPTAQAGNITILVQKIG